MKFWFTYLFRYVFLRRSWVPAHDATVPGKWWAVKRSTDQIHGHVQGWTLEEAQRYCDSMNDLP